MNKNLFIAGNWKSNKTVEESRLWLKQFAPDTSGATVVLCVPYTALPFFQAEIATSQKGMQLAAQDVSQFGFGAYTGEVCAAQIKEFAEWVVIGHSERRKNFGETDEILEEKVKRANEAGLQIIFCVQDENTPVPEGVHVVAYEPVWAIGTGKTDSPENANAVISKIKDKTHVKTCIYGGSITYENVKSFVDMPSIDGVLPGGASLDPDKFLSLIRAALS